MKRREFIPISLKVTLAVAFSGNLFTRCSFVNIDIHTIVGQPINSISKKKIEYEGNISCYSLTNFKSKFSDTDKVFIFCENDKIIGFSIKLKPTTKEQIKIPNDATLAYDNAFGSKSTWKENNKNISATIAKPYDDIKNFSFYSEYLDEVEVFIL